MDRWVIRADTDWDEEAVATITAAQGGTIVDEHTATVDADVWVSFTVDLPQGFDTKPWQAAGLWPFAMFREAEL